MWQPEDQEWAIGSFIAPVALPGADPDADPLLQVVFNASWLPYICGSLMQLVQIPTWATSNPTALALVQAQATDLIALFGAAMPAVVAPFPYPISNGLGTGQLISNGAGGIVSTLRKQ